MKPSLPAGASSRKETSASEPAPPRWSMVNGLRRLSSHWAKAVAAPRRMQTNRITVMIDPKVSEMGDAG
jgi:hypothetical protein